MVRKSLGDLNQKRPPALTDLCWKLAKTVTGIGEVEVVTREKFVDLTFVFGYTLPE